MLEPQKTGYLPSLDGLRCLSILIVIFSHIDLANHIIRNKQLSPYLASGVFGVHVFFVISGFIITTLLLKEQAKTGSISLRDFYFRRALRILPLAYAFLVVLMLLNSCFQLGIAPLDFVASFFFVKNAIQGAWYTGHYWSLSVEEQYYWIFPVLLSIGLRKYLSVCFLYLGLYCGKNILEHYLQPAGGAGIAYVFDVVFSNSMVSIIFGSLTSILLFRAGDRILTVAPKTFPLLIIQISAILLGLFFWVHPKLFGLSSILCSCSIAVAVLLLIRFPYGPLFWLLNSRPVVFIGKLSFSLYIWQQIFTDFQPWRHRVKYGDSIWLNMIGLSGVALLSHYLIEKPFLRLRSRYRNVVALKPAGSSIPARVHR